MFLLDTNVVSEMRRPRPSPAVRSWVESKAPDQHSLSVISLLEILRGASRHPDPLQRRSIQDWIDSSLRPWFETRILGVSASIAETAGIWMGARDLAGHPLSLPDALIAATTAHHHAVLVTRNTKDFANLPLDLFDPWTNQLTLGEKHR